MKSEVVEWMRSLCSQPEIRTKTTDVFNVSLCSTYMVTSREDIRRLLLLSWDEPPGYDSFWRLLKSTCDYSLAFLHLLHSGLFLESGSEYQVHYFLPYSLQADIPWSSTTPCVLVISGHPLWQRWSPELWQFCKTNCGAGSGFLTLEKTYWAGNYFVY